MEKQKMGKKRYRTISVMEKMIIIGFIQVLIIDFGLVPERALYDKGYISDSDKTL